MAREGDAERIPVGHAFTEHRPAGLLVRGRTVDPLECAVNGVGSVQYMVVKNIRERGRKGGEGEEKGKREKERMGRRGINANEKENMDASEREDEQGKRGRREKHECADINHAIMTT